MERGARDPVVPHAGTAAEGGRNVLEGGYAIGATRLSYTVRSLTALTARREDTSQPGTISSLHRMEAP